MSKSFILFLFSFCLAFSSIGCSGVPSNASTNHTNATSETSFERSENNSIVSFESLNSSDKKAEIFEIEKNSMVYFRMDYYTTAVDSAPGQPIKFVLDDVSGASFECKIETGSFSFYEDIKETIVSAGETIYYCPRYKKDKADTIVVSECDDYSFVDVVVKNNNGVIGYSVIKIICDEPNRRWHPHILVANLFVDENEIIVNVSSDYVKERIAGYHNLED